MAEEALVSVIIPAFNAAGAIAETLASVTAQSHKALEIIVVDDGSEDATAEIVRRHAVADPRVRLLVQANGGVAAARNAGLDEARGTYVAPIDADDLWRPDKIARQLGVMRRRGPRTALVYSWSANIDADGRVRSFIRSDAEGDVLARLCERNLVGNGSAALMRREAVLEVGGYDPGLRVAGAQGCEDLKLYLALAERHEFGLAPEPLTGYRQGPGAMSSDLVRMMRSFDLVMGDLVARRPDLAAPARTGRTHFLAYLFDRALKADRRKDATVVFKALLAHDAAGALRAGLAGFPGRRRAPAQSGAFLEAAA